MVFYTAVMGNLKVYMFIMLTYWSYYILATAQVLRAINSWYYVSLQKQGKGKSKLIFNNIGGGGGGGGCAICHPLWIRPS